MEQKQWHSANRRSYLQREFFSRQEAMSKQGAMQAPVSPMTPMDIRPSKLDQINSAAHAILAKFGAGALLVMLLLLMLVMKSF